jgi:hypothetical protein
MKKIKTIEAIYKDKSKNLKNENVVMFCKKCETEYHVDFKATGMTCCGDSITLK